MWEVEQSLNDYIFTYFQHFIEMGTALQQKLFRAVTNNEALELQFVDKNIQYKRSSNEKSNNLLEEKMPALQLESFTFEGAF